MMKKRINKNFRYNGGFDYFRVILIIAFVLATYYFTIFFDGVIRRKHLIDNKNITQNTPNLQIQRISVKLHV